MPASTISVHPTIGRIALAVAEASREHGLTRRELAEWSGVPAWTIAREEYGHRVRPAAVMQLGMSVIVLDAHRPPPFGHDIETLYVPGEDGFEAEYRHFTEYLVKLGDRGAS